MTQNLPVGIVWQEVTLGGDVGDPRWFVVTNENGGTGLEVAISTTGEEPLGKGHKLSHGEGITLNTGGNALFLRATQAGVCEAVITDWASA